MSYRVLKSDRESPSATSMFQTDPTILHPVSAMRTTLVSRNVTIRGTRTSVRLEPEMWNALKDIALREGTTIHKICSLVSLRKAPESSLTAAIRVFLMLYYRAAATSEGHSRAGHGNFEFMKHRARIGDDALNGHRDR